MANRIYHSFIEKLCNGTIDFDAGGTVVRCLLERDTSAYAQDEDHVFLDEVIAAGLVEISVASYLRKTVAAKAVVDVDAGNYVKLDFDDIAWAVLEAGETVRALIFYVEIGGDETSPEDDILICYIDTASGLPAALAGGAFNIVLDAAGFIQIAQP